MQEDQYHLVDILEFRRALPLDLCERLIHRYENDENRTMAPGSRGVLENHRECESLIISGREGWEQLTEELCGHLEKTRDTYFRYYELAQAEEHPIREVGYELAGYEVGQGCSRHVGGPAGDATGFRVASMVTYLNDIAEGGETVFPLQDVKIRPEAGKVLLTPASYTHPHWAEPPLSEKKYVVVTWLWFHV